MAWWHDVIPMTWKCYDKLSFLLGALTPCHVTVSHCHCWWIFLHMSPTGVYKIIILWNWSKGKFWNSQKSNIFVLRKGGSVWTLYLGEILIVRMNLPGKISHFVYLRKKIMKKYVTVSFIIYDVTDKLSRHPILTDYTRFCRYHHLHGNQRSTSSMYVHCD